MQEYFIKGLPSGEQVKVTDKDISKHMFTVMRLQVDDEVVLVFDDGIKRLARISDRDEQLLTLVEDLVDDVELPVAVTIAMGFPKGDKLEFVTQKATELGASQLWAFPADWSVVRWDAKKLAKKAEKLEKIAQGAAQQSKRNKIPSVQLFAHKKDFLAEVAQFDQIFLAYEESAKQGEQAQLVKGLSQLEPGQKILFIFGPEGGISPAEVADLTDLGAVSVGLGPRILRAETAPLYALSAVSVALELKG
ncbi:16S rRNA (uracil(1498)-N(3))-methyltransferase [Streptococcus cuniculipharyngis]|uniref:Ribosomal RNA small subunit methyltransferase E n=1 Tax=Streptococcus cuniculipharyngis TaxID=1562651 RepID=A0A5C5SCE7_9STRE|nr:16S rRNA (uracil(1498)-N(3))-methyltransferase [Streptococcus cuniculipharyngis]TWS97661.1 16S rRNA (uracil(1498)-N(3))-methyltransferase [Streptococcus cuniculipharyngis]